MKLEDKDYIVEPYTMGFYNIEPAFWCPEINVVIDKETKLYIKEYVEKMGGQYVRFYKSFIDDLNCYKEVE